MTIPRSSLEGQTVTPAKGHNRAPSASTSPTWGTCSPGAVGEAGHQHRPPLLEGESHRLSGILLNFCLEFVSVPGTLVCLHSISTGYTHVTK